MARSTNRTGTSRSTYLHADFSGVHFSEILFVAFKRISPDELHLKQSMWNLVIFPFQLFSQGSQFHGQSTGGVNCKATLHIRFLST